MDCPPVHAACSCSYGCFSLATQDQSSRCLLLFAGMSCPVSSELFESSSACPVKLYWAPVVLAMPAELG